MSVDISKISYVLNILVTIESANNDMLEKQEEKETFKKCILQVLEGESSMSVVCHNYLRGGAGSVPDHQIYQTQTKIQTEGR